MARGCYFAVKTRTSIDDTRYAPCKQSDTRECVQPYRAGRDDRVGAVHSCVRAAGELPDFANRVREDYEPTLGGGLHSC
jgi:hypothetical protein